MTFNKCSINGKSFGDPVDASGNAIEITEVSSEVKSLKPYFLQCLNLSFLLILYIVMKIYE